MLRIPLVYVQAKAHFHLKFHKLLNTGRQHTYSSGVRAFANNDQDQQPFKLEAEFVKKFEAVRPVFGFNGLGEIVFLRTYSRIKNDNNREQWFETVERVVNGTFNMQKNWMLKNRLPWDEQDSMELAQEMYRRIFSMKFLPPGRGLWAMGSPITEERGLFAALNSCGFVSTQDLAGDSQGHALASCDPSRPFCFLMDASMLGVGVGFDTKGSNKFIVQEPKRVPSKSVVIDDSREGWIESIKHLLDAYFLGRELCQFDYSKIRKAGLPIKGFGGRTMGSEPLQELHASLITTLDRSVGSLLSVTCIVDIMNLMGKCVISGDVRRTAEIAFGDPDSEEFINLKDFDRNPERASFGYTSNNSIFATVGMDYSKICEQILKNGEPGVAWLENMQAYGRIKDPPDYKDAKARGGNPCLEQTLESYEVCCLVETFPTKHNSLEDFLETLRYAYLYAKTVTLGETHWKESNEVMNRNRRIGCSMSGLAQFVTRTGGFGELERWCIAGYEEVQRCDKHYSERFGVPRSIKTTSIKPSGTVSLLAGATPGMHYPEARFYIRRIRLSAHSQMLPVLNKLGYRIEQAAEDSATVVVEIPVDVGAGIKTAKEVSMMDQLDFAAFLQYYWADNQVSCTVTFDPLTEGPFLAEALRKYESRLKGVSFLPRVKTGAYPQMPYEAITEVEYNQRLAELSKENLQELARCPVSENQFEEIPDKFCDVDGCNSNKDPTDK